MRPEEAQKRIRRGERNHFTFTSPAGEVTIGRQNADIRFDDPRMSRGGKVAIVWDGRQYYVENRGATNPPMAGNREITDRIPLDQQITYGHLLIEPHEGGFSIFHLSGDVPRLSERIAGIIKDITHGEEEWGDGRV